MQCTTVRRLGDLLTATKTISDNQRILVRLPHSRKQYPFANLYRYVVVVFLKTERASHTTTFRVKHLEIQSQLREHCLFIVHPHNGFVMAVSMHNRLTMLQWRCRWR